MAAERPSAIRRAAGRDRGRRADSSAARPGPTHGGRTAARAEIASSPRGWDWSRSGHSTAVPAATPPPSAPRAIQARCPAHRARRGTCWPCGAALHPAAGRAHDRGTDHRSCLDRGPYRRPGTARDSYRRRCVAGGRGGAVRLGPGPHSAQEGVIRRLLSVRRGRPGHRASPRCPRLPVVSLVLIWGVGLGCRWGGGCLTLGWGFGFGGSGSGRGGREACGGWRVSISWRSGPSTGLRAPRAAGACSVPEPASRSGPARRARPGAGGARRRARAGGAAMARPRLDAPCRSAGP